MTKHIIEELENMRYKYLSMKHDNMPETEMVIRDLVNDMTLICHVLKRILDPLEDSL